MRKNNGHNRGAALSVAIVVMMVFAIMTASFATYTSTIAKVNIKSANTITNNLTLESVDYECLYKCMDGTTIDGSYLYNGKTYIVSVEETKVDSVTYKYKISAYIKGEASGYYIIYNKNTNKVIQRGTCDRTVPDTELNS